MVQVAHERHTCKRRLCRRRAAPGSSGTCAAHASVMRRRKCRRMSPQAKPSARKRLLQLAARHDRGSGACAGTACGRPGKTTHPPGQPTPSRSTSLAGTRRRGLGTEGGDGLRRFGPEQAVDAGLVQKPDAGQRRVLHVLDGSTGIVEFNGFHMHPPTSVGSQTSRPWRSSRSRDRDGPTFSDQAALRGVASGSRRRCARTRRLPVSCMMPTASASTSGSFSFGGQGSRQGARRAAGAVFARACTTTSVRLPSVMSLRKSFFVDSSAADEVEQVVLDLEGQARCQARSCAGPPPASPCRRR